jgi:hypothetical protein
MYPKALFKPTSPAMTVRPPKLLAPEPNALDVLQHEMMQEKAATLARMTRALEHALAALAAFDAQRAAPDADSKPDAGRKSGANPKSDADRTPAAPSGPAEEARREALIEEAARALWQLSVQRDALGLPGSRTLARDYAVPPAVVARMGAAPRRDGTT